MSDAITRLNAALEGRYTIERLIGEGGMATVYLARDLKHNRNVALKVLKPELAAVVGAERFLTEIETTANLQHPHVLPLYDSGEADSFLFYVMPYVEGETLADRLNREKQLPVEEAVRIAVSVAGALDYAHRQGVVHRDIKPGNILMQDGQPVVGDFGIALAVGSAGGARLTETGLSVGTPYYMSPEQATGDMQVGPASDTYALAAVLYELLTGDPPYMGSTAQAVLGKIIQGQPVSATAVRRSIPVNVDAAIRKGLEKLPADRFTSAAEFSKALTDLSFRHGAELEGLGAGGGSWKRRARALAGVAVVSTGGLAWTLLTAPPPAPLPVERFEMPFRADQLPESGATGRDQALSPDGTFLVYLGPSDAPLPQLWIRRWDDPVAVPVRGTVGALDPAVSPDGREIAFTGTLNSNEVRVIPLEGGPARTLGPGTRPWWGPDGYLYYSAGDGSTMRVTAAGGEPEPFVPVFEGEVGSRVFSFFPGGKKVLRGSLLQSSDLQIQVVDVETRETSALVFGSDARLTPSGHLLYLADGTLMAAPMDLDRAEMTGPPVALIEDVSAFTISDTGKLFYSQGVGTGGRQELIWVTRTGAPTPVDPTWQFGIGGSNAGWSLSPDGTRVALREGTEDGLDIWVKELPDGPRSRLTFWENEDRKPVWGPDGQTVTFLSDRGGNMDAWAKRADGTADPALLYDDMIALAEATWSPDGAWLLVRTGGVAGEEGGRDVLAVSRDGTEVRPLLTGTYDEVGPVISPDGRWLAYTSNETGQHEVFVRPFPDVNAGRWQVSTAGGFTPRWAHGGKELFFVDQGNQMVSATLQTEGGFRVLARSVLFELPGDFITSDIAVPYNVGLDDQSFLMARNYRGDETAVEGPRYTLVQNFFEELRVRVPR